MQQIIRMHDFGNWEDLGERSYRAIISVFDLEGIPIFTGVGSSFPNPFTPHSPEIKTKGAYGCIRSGTYLWKYSNTAHNGEPGININNNQSIDTVFRNPNQSLHTFANHIDLHPGDKLNWRGSAGCPTVRPDLWPDFILTIEGNSGAFILSRAHEPNLNNIY